MFEFLIRIANGVPKMAFAVIFRAFMIFHCIFHAQPVEKTSDMPLRFFSKNVRCHSKSLPQAPRKIIIGADTGRLCPQGG